MISSFSDPSAQKFRDEIRSWLARELPLDWAEQQLRRTEDELFEVRRAWGKKLYEAGYAGLSWPERYGGRGAGAVQEMIFYDEIARAHAPEGLGRIGRIMTGPLIIDLGTEWQRDRFLQRILDGTEIWCLGYSEPSAGSDLSSLTTTAVRDGSKYKIRGRKIWTSFAHFSDRCQLLARTSTTLPRYQNMSMFLLDLHQPGITINPIITAAADHSFNEVVFDDAIVTVEERVGAENAGWQVFQHSLRYERGATNALSYYREMSRECSVLTGCCAKHSCEPGALRQAECITDQVDAVRWHIIRQTEMEACDDFALPAQVILKVFWSELWQQLSDFGSRISCNEHREFWRYSYLQSRAATVYSGTAEIQRNSIARRLLSGKLTHG
jgi:alkylation response protein AidB-like acyl-CoA dehydrogenase